MEHGLKRLGEEALGPNSTSPKRPKLNPTAPNATATSSTLPRSSVLEKLKQLKGKVVTALQTTPETVILNKDDKNNGNGWDFHNSANERLGHVSSGSKIDTTTDPNTRRQPVRNGGSRPMAAAPVSTQPVSAKPVDEASLQQPPSAGTRGRKPDHWVSHCQKILSGLASHRYAWPFNQPVDPVKLNLPDYFDIIKQPMDLGTVKTKLSHHAYRTHEDFAQDVRLIWNNCYLYNSPESDVVMMAHTLSKAFDQKYSKFVASLSQENVPKPKPKPVPTAAKLNETVPSPPTPVERSRSPPQETVKRPPSKPVTKQLNKRLPVDNEDDRPMSWDEKRALSLNIGRLPPEKLGGVLDIIRARAPAASNQSNDEIEIDLDKLDNITLRQLAKYVRNALSKKKRKTPKKPAAVNGAQPAGATANNGISDNNNNNSKMDSSNNGVSSDMMDTDQTTQHSSVTASDMRTPDPSPHSPKNSIMSSQANINKPTSQAGPVPMISTGASLGNDNSDTDSSDESTESDSDESDDEKQPKSTTPFEEISSSLRPPAANPVPSQSYPAPIPPTSSENSMNKNLPGQAPPIVPASVDDQEGELQLMNVDCWSDLANNASDLNEQPSSSISSSLPVDSVTSGDTLWNQFKTKNEIQKQKQKTIEELEKQKQERETLQKLKAEQLRKEQEEKAKLEAAEAKRKIDEMRMKAKMEREQMQKTVDLDNQQLIHTMSSLQTNSFNILALNKSQQQ